MELGNWSRIVFIFILVTGISCGSKSERSRLIRYLMTTPGASRWSRTFPSHLKYTVFPLHREDTLKQTTRESPISILSRASWLLVTINLVKSLIHFVSIPLRSIDTIPSVIRDLRYLLNLCHFSLDIPVSFITISFRA